jgi:MFS family permease
LKPIERSLGPDFSKLFGALVATKLGDGLIAAAGPLLAAKLTDDPFLIALIGALYMLPWLLFAIPIGTMVDRINRRRVLSVVNFCRAGIAAVLTVFLALGQLTLPVFYFALFLVGICDVISDTATQSLVPTMLKHDQIERGNSRIQGADTILMGFIGAPLGGFVFTIAIVAPWAVQSISFLAAAILVTAIPVSVAAGAASAAARSEKFVEQMKGGISYLWNDKKLLRLVVTTAALGFCFNVATATQVLFALKVQMVPESSYGLLATAGAIGALGGAYVAHRASQRFGRGLALALGITVTATFEFLQGLAPNAWVFALCMALGGFGVAAWNILLMSLYHSLIPNEIFGRIHGTRRTLVWGLMPIGAAIGGLISKIDLRLPYLIGGIVSVMIALFSFAFIRRLGDESERASESV